MNHPAHSPKSQLENAFPRVLHVTAKKGWRGGEQQVFYLVTTLHAWGASPEICCPEGSVLQQRLAGRGILIHTYPAKGLLNVGIARKLLLLCRKGNYDLLHAHEPHGHTACVLASIWGMKAPFVVSRRVDLPPGGNWFSSIKYNWNSLKALICISEKIKRINEPHLRNKALIRVVHSGVDPDRFARIKRGDILRTRFRLSESNLMVGMVAALDPMKDYPTFLRVADAVRKSRPEARFFCIGEGSERAKIERMISEMGLQDHVFLTGFIEQVAEVLMELDYFMITSLQEGLGTSVLDAFAAGIPVVATRAGGIPEMVFHEKTGMLAEPGDASTLSQHLLRVIENRELRLRLISGARMHLENFTIDKMTLGNLQVYREVCNVPSAEAG